MEKEKIKNIIIFILFIILIGVIIYLYFNNLLRESYEQGFIEGQPYIINSILQTIKYSGFVQLMSQNQTYNINLVSECELK